MRGWPGRRPGAAQRMPRRKGLSARLRQHRRTIIRNSREDRPEGRSGPNCWQTDVPNPDHAHDGRGRWRGVNGKCDRIAPGPLLSSGQGYTRILRTDNYLRFRMTVHKLAPRKGLAVTCVPRLGICQRQAPKLSS
jgi:hypothetical protein